MTVSNVVNGRGGVSSEVRERVMQHVRASGYHMNLSARNLRRGRRGVIGLAVPELSSAYFANLSSRITHFAQELGYRVIVEETEAQADGEREAIGLSRSLDCDGLIISTVQLSVDDRIAENLPIVLLGEVGTSANIDHIAQPNFEGARAATELLLRRGCERIVYVGRDLNTDHALSPRVNGYLAALEEAQISTSAILAIHTPKLTSQEGKRAATQVREFAADGVVAVTDEVAIGVIRGLTDFGIGVPNDVQIVGFDNVPIASQTIPALTTIALDHDWTARRSVELLISRIDKSAETRHADVAPFELIERESTRRK